MSARNELIALSECEISKNRSNVCEIKTLYNNYMRLLEGTFF